MTQRNMSLSQTRMPVQEPEVRSKNFGEVALGYTKSNGYARSKTLPWL